MSKATSPLHVVTIRLVIVALLALCWGTASEAAGGTWSITPKSAIAAEGNSGLTALTFDIKFERTANGTAAVTWTPTDGTAVGGAACSSGVDFISVGGTITWASSTAGTSTVTVSVCGDHLTELDESFAVVLSNATAGTTISTASANGNITNDDASVISISSPSTVEGGTLAFTVTLDYPVDVAVTADRATADGAATLADNDYTALASANTTLFAPSSTSPLTINVATTADSKAEPHETLFLLLSNLSAGGRSVTFSGAGATLTGTGTILNDDLTPVTLESFSVAEGGHFGAHGRAVGRRASWPHGGSGPLRRDRDDA